MQSLPSRFTADTPEGRFHRELYAHEEAIALLSRDTPYRGRELSRAELLNYTGPEPMSFRPTGVSINNATENPLPGLQGDEAQMAAAPSAPTGPPMGPENNRQNGPVTPAPWIWRDSDHRRPDTQQGGWERPPPRMPEMPEWTQLPLSFVRVPVRIDDNPDQVPDMGYTLLQDRGPVQDTVHAQIVNDFINRNPNSSPPVVHNIVTDQTGLDPVHYDTIDNMNVVQHGNLSFRDFRTREQLRKARVRIAAHEVWETPMTNTQYDGNGLLCVICLCEFEEVTNAAACFAGICYTPLVLQTTWH